MSVRPGAPHHAIFDANAVGDAHAAEHAMRYSLTTVESDMGVGDSSQADGAIT